MPERLYSTFQIADLLDVSPSTVLEWIDQGRLSCRRLAVGPRVTEAAVRDFLQRRGVDVESILAAAQRKANRGESAPGAPDPAPSPLAPAPRRLAARAEPEPEPEPAPQAATTGPATAPQIAQAVLRDGVVRGAEAIHLEPTGGRLTLRLRLDGVMHEKVKFRDGLPDGAAEALIETLKGFAGLAPGRPGPQSGEFRQAIDGRDVCFRVVTLPTPGGDRLVLHVIDPETSRPGQADLLGPVDLTGIHALLAQPCGLLLVAAAGRRDRSAVLRAMVGALNTRARNVITVEVSAGPVIEGVSQSVPQPVAGYSQGDALAAAGDQDPDVVMIEEIRDPAAAATAVELAGERCMVLVGVPARSSAQALARFAEMSGRPDQLAGALLAVVHSQIVRRLCGYCRGAGCPRCSNTGYAGIVALSAIAEADARLARAVRLEQGSDALRSTESLQDVARRAVAAGVTSEAEIARVLPVRGVGED